jgi:TolB-like protein/Flp pilus assembly protein TadD
MQRLQPNLPETQLALGYYQFQVLGDYGLAKTTFRLVSKTLPGSSEVPFALGSIAEDEGDWNESVAYFEQGLSLDPRNVELLKQAAFTYAWLRQFPKALKLYDRALDIIPNDPETMAYKAAVYQAQGNLQGAAKLLSERNAQHPFENASPSASVTVLRQLRLERNYAELVRLLQTQLTQFHFDSDLDKGFAQVNLAFAQYFRGDNAGAKITAEQARYTLEPLCKSEPNNVEFARLLSLNYAALENKESAINEAQRAIILSQSANDRMNGSRAEEVLAVIQARFGENSSAISTLSRLLQTAYGSSLGNPMPLTPALLRLDPFWDPLRSDPAFQKLCEDKLSKSIAVLPFENLSEEKANAYFAEGIQDEILTRLSKIADLKVISRTSTRQYQPKPGNLEEIAKQLGVAHVLEGSVQRAANKIRVNAQLIDARNDAHVWAKSYDRDLKDVLAVESEVSQEIAEALQAKLSPSESHALASAGTGDPEAYDLFLRGEYESHQSESKEDADANNRAEEFYRQALARDPNFADAAAGVARSRLRRHWFFSPLTPSELKDVTSIIDRALALDPNSPQAHLALGLFFYRGHRQYEIALTEFNHTLELQPNNALARQYSGWIYRRRGEWERSLADLQRAQELDPRDAGILVEIGGTYQALRLWKDAERATLRALAMDPRNNGAADILLKTRLNSTSNVDSARRLFDGFPEDIKSSLSGFDTGGYGEGARNVLNIIGMPVYLDLLQRRFSDALQSLEKEAATNDREHLLHLVGRVVVRLLAGQTEAAKSVAEQALPLLEASLRERPDDAFAITELSWVYLALGRDADALRLSRQAADLMPIEKDALSGPTSQLVLAQIEARAGAPEEAINRLRRLLSIPAGHAASIALLKVDPVWDPLRNRPDFQQLLSGPEQVGPNK